MAKVIIQEYDDTIVLMYPECPYAGETVPDVHKGIPYEDFVCIHPEASETYCGTHHYYQNICPFLKRRG